MLSAAQLRGVVERRRTPYSDKQHYQEYILQRIEGFKNSIGRDELLRLGDEAASELRLALRPYGRWRRQFLKLREAQRTPTHWGLEPTCPLARLLPRIESQDNALVIGSGAEPTAYLLAAHDAVVTFLANDLGCVERVESRMAAEALGSLFEGYVAQIASCLPDFLHFVDAMDLVVLDPGALVHMSPACRVEFVRDLQRRSRPGCVHILLPTCQSLAPEALLTLYQSWTVEDGKRRRRAGSTRQRDGIVLSMPACPPNTTKAAAAGSE